MEQQALGCVRPADGYQQQQQTTMLYATPQSRPVAPERNFTRGKEKRKGSRGRTDDSQTLSKSMIGPPIDFQHVGHANMDPASSYPPTRRLHTETVVDRRPQQDDPGRQKHTTNTTESHDHPKTKKLGRRQSSGRLNDPPAPQVRKDMIGPPTNFQHVSHVGFDDNTTSYGTEERWEPHDSSKPEVRVPDLENPNFYCDSTDVDQQEGQWENRQWSRPSGDRGQQEVQWETKQWTKTDGDDGHQDSRWENQLWPRPDSDDGKQENQWAFLADPSSSIFPPPAGLRKDMIGPPTNFQHVLHVGPDVVDVELEQLMKMANLNQHDKPDLATAGGVAGVEESTGDLEEAQQHQASPHDTDDLPSATHIPTPPPRVRSSAGGSGFNYQHVSHVRFSDSSTVLQSSFEDQQLPLTVARNFTFDLTDDGQQEGQWENQNWSKLKGDGDHQEAQRKMQRWSGLDLQDDLAPPITPPPAGLRKDMIGPPTNFQHVCHVDQDNVNQELQQLAKASTSDKPALDLGTSKSMPNLMERREVLRRVRSQQNDRHCCSSGTSSSTRVPSPPPPRMRKDMIGPPTNFQHVSHVGFDDNTTSQVAQGQHAQDPFRETGWDEQHKSETKAGSFIRGDPAEVGEGGQQQQQRARWEKQRWSSPGTLEEPTASPPRSPPPGLSKEMIGPPTNFKHVRHLDPDSVQQELQHLTKEGDGKVSRRPSTRRDLQDPAPSSRVRKGMIGPPTNFQHVAHVGINSSWQTSNEDDDDNRHHQQLDGAESHDILSEHRTADGAT